MYIDFNCNRESTKEGKFGVPVLRLENDEKEHLAEYVEMARKQQVQNPAATFTDATRDYAYDDVSDETYEKHVETIKLLSNAWKEHDKALVDMTLPIYEVSSNNRANKTYIVPFDSAKSKGHIGLFQLLEALFVYAETSISDYINHRVVLYRIKVHMKKLKQDADDMTKLLGSLKTLIDDNNLEKMLSIADDIDTSGLEAEFDEIINDKPKSKKKKTVSSTKQINSKTEKDIKSTLKKLSAIMESHQQLINDIDEGLEEVDPNVKDHYNDDRYSVNHKSKGHLEIFLPKKLQQHMTDEEPPIKKVRVKDSIEAKARNKKST